MKPSIPRGTRDFGPADMKKRQFIFDKIRSNFELFGFEPIETPAMENIATLTGKYGDEGDQLIFKILNSRLYESKHKDLLLNEFNRSLESNYNSVELTERALRYDLTVPFARFVVLNQHNLTFPFKRYQMQPVWRADRPQKGRYREFYQCDADIIGSDSLMNELDLIMLMDKIFAELNIPVVLKFNNRKILTAIAEIIGEAEKIIDITVAIDKLEKIGELAVVAELKEKGLNDRAINLLKPLLSFKGNNAEKVAILQTVLGNNASGEKGLQEINFLLHHANVHHMAIELDINLARGLNYYTGSIFEVKTNAGTFTSSILGGGRYDNLTGVFGLQNMSGIGISFGLDRIADVMDELNLYPPGVLQSPSVQVLFTHFDDQTRMHCLGLVSALRLAGISSEIYPELTKKLGKQFDYANKKNIPFVITIGSNEIETGMYAFKNMLNGEQEKLDVKGIINKLINK